MARPAYDFNYVIKFDPRRQPTWRYERVQKLITDRKPVHAQRDDKYIRKLRKMYIERNNYSASDIAEYDSRAYLAAKYKELWLADRIFSSGRSDRTRFGVEAMLLARMSDEAIAEQSGVTPETVSVYEKLFFNVRDRLDNKNYIASEVLGNAFMAGLSNKSMELTAKYFGYFGGPLILELILDAFDGSIEAPTESRDMGDWLSRQYKLRLGTQSVVASTFFDPTNYNVRTLFESYHNILSLQQRDLSSQGDDNIINKALQTFLNVQHVPVGHEADKLLEAQFKDYSTEVIPRVSQKLQISRGDSVELIDKFTSPNWKSPKNRKSEDGPSN
jgi:hypothetical protein